MRALYGLAATTAFRWTAAAASGFAIMAVLLFSFIYWQTALYERRRIDDLVTRVAELIAAGPPADAAGTLSRWLADDPHGVRYGGLFDANGSHLSGVLETPPEGLPTDGRAHRVVFHGIDRDHDGDDPEVVRAAAIRLGDGRLLVAGYDIDELENVQAIILRALGLGLLPAVLLSLMGGTVLARRAQRRIAAVHEAIGKIMRGRLSERLPVRGSGDDLDRLAIAVNGMLQEIERLVGEIRGVGDSIAHDLRTPLTRARARLERCRDEARTPEEFQASADKAIASVDQALGVIAAVLRIGEIEHGRRRAAFGPLDLASLLRDAAELYEPLAEEKDVLIRLDLPVTATLVGDRDLLLEVVGNLVDNAVKFAPVGTEIVLSLARDGERTRLRVADRGPGIAAEEREHVLQRFYQTERSRALDGSGLGLSLVAAVVRLHGLRLEVGDAEPGCLVELICPVRPRLHPTGLNRLRAHPVAPTRAGRLREQAPEPDEVPDAQGP
jgi:signal transduction histidine kinase